jgi:hypothetical protein
MQELGDSIKRPNLTIMGIEEGAKMKAKRIGNIFKKIMKKNVPKLKNRFAHSGTGTLKDTKQNCPK